MPAAFAGICLAEMAGQAAPAGQPEAVPGAGYAGSDKCMACHLKQTARLSETLHGKIVLRRPRTELEKHGCEACHGPRSAHVADIANLAARGPFGPNSKAGAREQNAQCLQCHDKGERLFWKGSPHELRRLACTRCHRIHSAASARYLLARQMEAQLCSECHRVKKAQLLRTSHMPLREGKLTCSDCHNPHGTVTNRLIRENSVNENCYRCHPEHRGPFMWEHPPVLEDCLNCHEPHGSIHDKLLKMKRERLCQRCHVPFDHPSQPHGPGTRSVFNRSCQNCHPMIHGSNHPSGKYFLR